MANTKPPRNRHRVRRRLVRGTEASQITASVSQRFNEAVEVAPTPVLDRSADPLEEMPLPTDPNTIFLGGLFLIAFLVVLYVAAEIVLPVVLAIILKLLLQPFVRMLDRLGLPRGVGAVVAIVVLVISIAAVVSGIAGPGVSWAGKLPSAIPEMQQKLAFLQRPLNSVQWVLQQVQGIFSGGGGSTALPQPPAARLNLLGVLFTGTAAVATGLFTMLLVLFYLLASGDIFLRRIVEILPTFGDKRQAVETSLHIEHDVSAYLVTVSLINITVGLCTLVIMWGCGVANPLLWGVIALVLNYVPIIGAVVGMIVFLMASVLSLGVTLWALLPVGLYVCVHVIEGEFITPLLVARRFTINPVAVILALIFWYWMWGAVGVILAVPMLAIIKIICDDLRPLRAFGHLLEG